MSTQPCRYLVPDDPGQASAAAWRAGRSLAASARGLRAGAGPRRLRRWSGPLAAGALSRAWPSWPSPRCARAPGAAGGAARLAASGPGSLLREGDRVLVDVRFGQRRRCRRRRRCARAGARILHVSRRYQTVTVAVDPGRPARAGRRSPGSRRSARPGAARLRAVDCAGARMRGRLSEGDRQLRADDARSRLRGRRQRGHRRHPLRLLRPATERPAAAAATHAADDVASGDLPGPATPAAVGSCRSTSSTTSGTRGASRPTRAGRWPQIVHDLAPGASLAFATAFEAKLAFAENIEGSLAGRGGAGEVIVDDVAYFEEPFFQDGPVAAAVNEVTAGGVAYFSAAGNNNLIDAEGRRDRLLGSAGIPRLRDLPGGGRSLAAGIQRQPLHGLRPGRRGTDTTFGITVRRRGRPSPSTSSGRNPGTASTPTSTPSCSTPKANSSPPRTKTTSGDTEQRRRPRNRSSCSVGKRHRLGQTSAGDQPLRQPATTDPRLKFGAAPERRRGDAKPSTRESRGGDVVGPTIFGHTGAAGAVSLGAVRFDDHRQPERYSSRGPVTHYFGPVRRHDAPAPALADRSIAKPDLVATDCGAHHLLRRLRRRCLALLRHLGGGARTPPRSRPWLRRPNPRWRRRRSALRLRPTARPVGAFGPERGRRRPARRLRRGRRRRPAAVGHDHQRPRAVGATARRASASAPTGRSTFACSLDGGAPLPCASPFAAADPALGRGPRLRVRGNDLAGRSGSANRRLRGRHALPGPSSRKPRKMLRTGRPGLGLCSASAPTSRGRPSSAGSTAACPRSAAAASPAASRRQPHGPGQGARRAPATSTSTPAVFRFRVERVG